MGGRFFFQNSNLNLEREIYEYYCVRLDELNTKKKEGRKAKEERVHTVKHSFGSLTKNVS